MYYAAYHHGPWVVPLNHHLKMTEVPFCHCLHKSHNSSQGHSAVVFWFPSIFWILRSQGPLHLAGTSELESHGPRGRFSVIFYIQVWEGNTSLQDAILWRLGNLVWWIYVWWKTMYSGSTALFQTVECHTNVQKFLGKFMDKYVLWTNYALIWKLFCNQTYFLNSIFMNSEVSSY